MRTFKGVVVGHLDGVTAHAPVDGVLRGIARDSTVATVGVKFLEIDARGRDACWTGIDERGRAIAEATLKAISLHAPQPAMRDTASQQN